LPGGIETSETTAISAANSSWTFLRDGLEEDHNDEDLEEYDSSNDCRSWGECYGRARWDFDDDEGGVAGHCTSCGLFHIRCSNCGEMSWHDEDQTVHCESCDAVWELQFEKGDVDGIELVKHEAATEDEDLLGNHED